MLNFLILFFSLIFYLEGFEFHVCTVASHQNQQLEQLLISAAKQAIPVEVLGLSSIYRGNGQKLIYVQQYLQSIPDEDILLFVDGYDVFFLGGKEAILRKFLAFNKPIVFAAERGCHPLAHLADKYPESRTSFRFLNTGAFIGYAGQLKQLLLNISPINPQFSDQGQLTNYYLKHLSEMTLDYECHLFVCLHDVARKEYSLDRKEKKLKWLETATEPEVIHCNGNGKEIYQKIFEKLIQ